jgi:hypothetical protein
VALAPAPTSPVPTAAASTILALKAPTASAPTTPFPTALFPTAPVAPAPTDAAPTATALAATFGYGSDSAKMMRLTAPAPALQFTLTSTVNNKIMIFNRIKGLCGVVEPKLQGAASFWLS